MEYDLQGTFGKLKDLMAEYESSFTVRHDLSGRYELWSVKDVLVEGRKRKEVFFASAIIQRGYVGFYFMPVYVEGEILKVFDPELLRLLKGKSCFHIKAIDESLERMLAKALRTGFEIYIERGWI